MRLKNIYFLLFIFHCFILIPERCMAIFLFQVQMFLLPLAYFPYLGNRQFLVVCQLVAHLQKHCFKCRQEEDLKCLVNPLTLSKPVPYNLFQISFLAWWLLGGKTTHLWPPVNSLKFLMRSQQLLVPSLDFTLSFMKQIVSVFQANSVISAQYCLAHRTLRVAWPFCHFCIGLINDVWELFSSAGNSANWLTLLCLILICCWLQLMFSCHWKLPYKAKNPETPEYLLASHNKWGVSLFLSPPPLIWWFDLSIQMPGDHF